MMKTNSRNKIKFSFIGGSIFVIKGDKSLKTRLIDLAHPVVSSTIASTTYQTYFQRVYKNMLFGIVNLFLFIDYWLFCNTQIPKNINLVNKNTNVLFVRHCFACHNLFKSLNKKLLNHSNCTHIGLTQAYQFGKMFNELNKNSLQKKSFSLYSSTLPRAFMTAKVITLGFNNSIKNNFVYKKIVRCDFLTEKSPFVETALGFGKSLPNKSKRSTVNSITKSDSNKYANMYNDILPQTFSVDENKIISNKNNKNNNHLFTSGGVNNDYKNFVTHVLPSFTKGNEHLNIVIGHSAYLKKVFNLKNKLDNLDAVFVSYDNKGNSTEPSIFSLFNCIKSNTNCKLKSKNNQNNRNNSQNLYHKKMSNNSRTFYQNINISDNKKSQLMKLANCN